MWCMLNKMDHIWLLLLGLGEGYNNMVRIIIAGSRKFNDYPRMVKELDNLGIHLINSINPIEIVSGHAPGADTLGEKFAKAYDYPLKIFPAEWDKYGKAAGPIRNEQMAKYAAEADMGILIAFPIGESKGTRNMIKLAQQYGLEICVIEE